MWGGRGRNLPGNFTAQGFAGRSVREHRRPDRAGTLTGTLTGLVGVSACVPDVEVPDLAVPDVTGRGGKQAPLVEVATMDNGDAGRPRVGRHSERDANDNRPR
jgi:hypothetical protein